MNSMIDRILYHIVKGDAFALRQIVQKQDANPNLAAETGKLKENCVQRQVPRKIASDAIW